MKVLLIGMDGAHMGAFKRGWTPFISSLIEKGEQLNIKNDLISRGWLEIATGKHASVTGAMYDNPKMGGSYDWNLAFNAGNDIPGINSEIKPVWQVLSEEGFRVGVMNLPTVFPAPKVNGFFVAGGGGGGPVVERAIPELCFPEEILSKLQKNNYIVDERIVQLVVDKKLDTSSLIFKELANKNRKRTLSFIELAKDYKIDFGFVVYKTSSVTAETVLVPEWEKVVNNESGIEEGTIDALKAYYQDFDNEIKKLKAAFPDAEIVFVSDHGTVARTHTVNLNIFLQNLKYQYPLAGRKHRKYLIQYAKRIIPFSIKVRLQKFKYLKRSVESVVDFDTANSLAFCHTKNDWNHGIYINDEKRFKGPVQERDIEKVKKEIIAAFNSDAQSQKHGLFAYSIKEKLTNPVEHFPDIIVDIPSGYLTEKSSKDFVKQFHRPKGIKSLSSVFRGDIIAIKSHEPLAVDCGKSAGEDKGMYEGRDLTAIYDLVLRKFGIDSDKGCKGVNDD